MIIAKEKHKDGGTHYHVLIKFSKKVDIRNQNYFDVLQFHPNIQAVRHWGKTLNYIKKDGNFKEYGQIDKKVTSTNLPEFNDKMTKLEWLTACFEHKVPYGYAQAMWEELCPNNKANTIIEYDESNLSKCSPLLKIMKPQLDHLKSYVIVGPSGCGKTTWAKVVSIKPCLLVTHMDDLKKFKVGYHQSIIFDDMSFNHLDTVLQIPICDRYDLRSVHCRYATALIPAGIS